ncbi:MAG: flagellar filament capping protein FliD [Sedimentibacter saalensis]|uniref:flagellar filament capping protein FliD n=1 Tax=Sedimentibacter saalensis TaxID=130788 RepID=UPI0031594DCF
MSTLSTSLYGSSTSKGFGGLVSGLDTDDLVNQMLAGTKSKINKQYQAKQKLLYRQEAYREISSKLVSFNNTYFSYSSGSSTNILNSKFFESYKYTSSSKYVNVTGNADNISNFSINEISSVATSASFASNKQVASTTFESDEFTQYSSPLAGATMTLEYGGKSYNLQMDKDFGKGLLDESGVQRHANLQDVADELNEQIAKISGLNVTAKVENNKISISSTVEGKTVKMTAASNAFTKNLGMNIGQTPTSIAINSENENVLYSVGSEILSNKEAYISFELNGVVKKINMQENTANGADLADKLQEQLKAAYGEGKVAVKFIDNKITFEATSDTDIFGVSSISTELSNYTGIETGDYNRVNKTRALSQLGLPGLETKDTYKIMVNDVPIEIKNTMSVTDVINTINSNAEAGVKVYYSSTTNTFTVKSTETGSHKGVSIADVDGGGNLAATLFGTGVKLSEGERLEAVATNPEGITHKIVDNNGATIANVTLNSDTNKYSIDYLDDTKDDLTEIDYFVNSGTDTVMTYTLNGVKNTITRSTANFTIDDINLELNEKAAGLTSAAEPITFDAVNNADEVVEKVKKFIDTYNEIITLIGTKTSEKPNREYNPLTPDQQEEMEENEIKDWNAQAKKGILFGDNNMNNLMRKMKQIVSGSTSVSSLTLSSIGISSASMDTSGKLVFDQEKFKKKLLENPEEISNLFSGTTSDANGVPGIAVQMRELLVANVGAYGTTGILIDEAGQAGGMTSDQNNISEKIKDYDDKMKELKNKMEAERKRYWNQFSSLETTLNKLNSQSSWLTDMFS